MSDVDVISGIAGSADAASGLSGNPTASPELVAGSDAQLGGAGDVEKRIRDLQSARDSATSKLTKAEREAQTYRQQLEQTKSFQTRYTDVFAQALEFHLSHGEAPDTATARQWAQEDADEYMNGVTEHETVKAKAAKVDEQEKRAEAKAQRATLIKDVLEETGLSREQLHAAVKGIDINAPNVNELVWRAAVKAKAALTSQEPNVQNRQLVQQLGFPAAGTSAQGLATLPAHPPEGMSRADPRWKAMVQAERNRLRGL